MSIIIKESNNLVMETNKVSARWSVIHAGQRYAQSLKGMEGVVQVTILIATESLSDKGTPALRLEEWEGFNRKSERYRFVGR